MVWTSLDMDLVLKALNWPASIYGTIKLQRSTVEPPLMDTPYKGQCKSTTTMINVFMGLQDCKFGRVHEKSSCTCRMKEECMPRPPKPNPLQVFGIMNMTNFRISCQYNLSFGMAMV